MGDLPRAELGGVVLDEMMMKTMRKTLQMLLASLILLGLASPARAQADAAFRHTIKADMLFPFYLWMSSRQPYVYGRVSAEYERQSIKYKHLSWVGDFEFASRPYIDINHLFTWPQLKPPLRPSQAYLLEGRAIQNSYSLNLGIRYRIQIDKVGRIGVFGEPRAQISWIHARIFPYDVGLPIEVQDKLEVFPRLRMGGFLAVGRRWLLEPSLEVLCQHYLAGGKHEVLVFPEMNLGYRI